MSRGASPFMGTVVAYSRQEGQAIEVDRPTETPLRNHGCERLRFLKFQKYLTVPFVVLVTTSSWPMRMLSSCIVTSSR